MKTNFTLIGNTEKKIFSKKKRLLWKKYFSHYCRLNGLTMEGRRESRSLGIISLDG